MKKDRTLIQWLIISIALFTIFFPNYLVAQAVEGRVTTIDGNVVEGANIVLYNKNKNSIIGYGISNSDGYYFIKHESKFDSLTFKISHLSYGSQKKSVPANQEILDWILIKAAFNLPSMEVRSPAVVQRGDTLVFDANNLREISDESLEDVISRIPGIRIERNGRIKYKGLPISRFYIEGLDLLEGRYALATRNLRIDAIRDIEVLQEHQHIRALDSLSNPPNAALNIRLKSSITFTGKGEIGGGLSPMLYQLDAVLFGFQKAQQISIIGTANNTGRAQRDNFKNLSTNSFQSTLISPQIVRSPFNANIINFRDNREKTGGINILRKINKTNQLKIQLFGSRDRVNLSGRQQITLRDENSIFRFEEQLLASQALSLGNGRLIWERNQKKIYLKSMFEVDYRLDNLSTDNLVNLSPIREDFINPFISLKGETDVVLRKGKRAFRFWVNSSYIDNNYDFKVQPIPLSLIDIDFGEEISVSQVIRQRELQSEFYSRLFLRAKNFNPNIQVGVISRTNRLDSNLGIRNNSPLSSTDGNIKNATKRDVISPYLRQVYEWKLGKFNTRLQIPLSFHLITTNDFNEGIRQRDVFFVTTSNLSFSRKFTNGDYFTFGVNLSADYDRDQNFYLNSILTTNRRVTQGILTPNYRRQAGVDIIYMKHDAFKGISYRGILGLSSTSTDQISTNSFDIQGNISSILLTDNKTNYIQFSNRFDSNLGSSGLIKIDIGYGYSISPTVLNGQQVTIQRNDLNFKTDLSWTFGNNALTAQPYLKAIFNSISVSNVWQSNIDLTYFRKLPNALGKFNISWVGYQTITGSRKIRNQLFNIWYKTKIEPWKLNISLYLTNLTNANDFVTFQQFSFSEELSQFKMRPRQILLTLKKEI